MTYLSHVSKMSGIELELALRETCGLIQRLHSTSSHYFLPITNAIKGKEETYFRTDSRLWKDILHFIQFHDIIRQRLEHVEELLHSLRLELQTVGSTSHLDSTLYLAIMPKLMELNIAQLSAINDEFQASIQSMEKVLENAEGMENLKRANVIEATSAFSNISAKAIAELYHLAGHLTHVAGSNPSLNHVEKLYTMESERRIFYRVFQLSVENSDISDNDIIDLF